MIRITSSLLYDHKLERGSGYLANFYLQIKEKSSSTTSWQVEQLTSLAFSEADGEDISRSVKIIGAARKIADSAGDAGPNETNRINWTFSFPNVQAGDPGQAIELSAGMENSRGDMFMIQTLTNYLRI